jgi:hypothetical protein
VKQVIKFCFVFNSVIWTDHVPQALFSTVVSVFDQFVTCFATQELAIFLGKSPPCPSSLLTALPSCKNKEPKYVTKESPI